MSIDRDPIVAHLRAVRENRALSLARAGQLCGLDAVVLGSYERGDRQPPLCKLRRWSGGLGQHLMIASPGGGTGPVRIEYFVRYGNDGLIDCDSLEEATALAAHVTGARVAFRQVWVGPVEEHRG